MCFLFSIREARTLTVAIGVARLALRALEGKMAGAILSPHVLPSQVSIPAFGQTASQKFGDMVKLLQWSLNINLACREFKIILHSVHTSKCVFVDLEVH